MAEVPRVGVAAIVLRNDEEFSVLMGLRKGSHGSGTWALPGGHLEWGEHFTVCAEREMLEETGLHVKSKGLVAVTNDLIPSRDTFKHYVTLFVLCEPDDAHAEPEIKEPDKCDEWKWVPWSTLRTQTASTAGSKSEPAMPLFMPVVNLLADYPDFESSLMQ